MTTAINILKPHLAINVRNVESSIEFYKKMFAIEPSKVRTGYAKFDVSNPPLNFTLNQVPFGERGALSHLGIQVAGTDDVVAMREKWTEAGLQPREEMQTTCCYALQDKAWVNDPDGNEWEVFTVLQDNLGESSMRSDVAGCECASEGASASAQCVLPAAVDSAEAVHNVSCGCEAAAPAEGADACCDTQAKKFNIEIKARSTCCAE